MSEDNYLFKESEVKAYANACLKVAEAFKRINPDALLCTLRGSVPPTRIMLRLLDKIPGRFTAVSTSNYVKDRDSLLRVAVDDLVGNVVDDKGSSLEGRVKIFTVDTAISGTSTKHFMDKLKQYLPDIEDKYEVRVDYFLVKLWQKPSQSRQSRKSTRFHCNCRTVNIQQGVIYVPNLLCEDVDGLLGMSYEFTRDRGIKSAKVQEVNDPRWIVVDREKEGETPNIYMREKASDAFVEMIVEYANEISQERELRAEIAAFR